MVDKQPWEKLAEKAKVEHELRYPDYKFKPKKSNKKLASGNALEKKQDTKQEPPRKRRRMDELLANSALEILVASEGEVTREVRSQALVLSFLLTLSFEYECFPLAGPSSANNSVAVPLALEEDIHSPLSFAPDDVRFNYLFCLF